MGSDDLFRNVVETVRESLLVMDGELRVSMANPAFYKTFKVEPAETEGRLLWELGNGQWDLQELKSLLLEILPTQNPILDYRVEHDFPTIGHKVMILNACKIEAKDLILLAIEDVTDRLRIEREGREAAEMYKMMVDSVADHAIFMLDADCRVKTWNDACRRVKGWREEEVIGQYFSIFHTPEDNEAGKPEIEREICLRDNGYRNEEIRVRSDGTRYWARISLTPMHDKNGTLVGFIKVLQNIDHRKRAELEAEKSQLALREAAQRKDEFLAMLAHELRNPMATIQSGVQLIQMTKPDNPIVTRTLDGMLGQMDTLIRLVDDLMDVSRITQGKITLKKDDISLCRVVESAVNSVQHHLSKKNQRLHVNIDSGSDIHLRADPARLHQIIGNLLNNASKYTQAGGIIILQCEAADDEVFIRVQDNGRGIPKEMQERIFDLFFQMEKNPQTGGLGIGLSLVKSLVLLHNGTITAQSEGPGQGSVFEVRLPRAASLPKGRPQNGSHDARIEMGVVIVDDNSDHAENLAAMLQIDGYNVDVAYNGEGGLRLINEVKPMALILDLAMPDMSGYEVLNQIPLARKPYTVAVTGYGQQSDRDRTHHAGFDEHLVKPIKYETLVEALQRAAIKMRAS